jgi:uncharacterized repeat protein (TIGR01451 family)
MIAVLMLMSSVSASAFAAAVWRIDSVSNTTVAPGGTLTYLVQITSVGDAGMDGSEIDLTGTLPPGLTAVDATLATTPFNLNDPGDVPCTAGDGVSPVAGASDIRCTDAVALPAQRGAGFLPYQRLVLTVRADPGLTLGTTIASSFSVGGGGAGSMNTVDPTRVAAAPFGYGVDAFDGELLDANGDVSTQAGGHPASATVSFDVNTFTRPGPIGGPAWPVEPPKDVIVDLPPGLVGDPTAADQCTASQLSYKAGLETKTLCPPTAQVGTILLRTNNMPLIGPVIGPLPIFNIVPPPDVPARFGLNYEGTVVLFDATVRSGGDYGISVNSTNISQALPLAGSTVTLWGVPSDPSHDLERACPDRQVPGVGGPSCTSSAPPRAFLRNPTSCTAPGEGLAFAARTDSWFDPGVFQETSWQTHALPGYPASPSEWGEPVGTTGCAKVPFDPLFQAGPLTPAPSSASGFAFDLTLPQSDEPDAVGESDLRRAVVTLPAGVRLNPSAANGLGSCSPAQIDLHGEGEPSCPDAAKIGTVTIDTPLLDDPLQGAIYQASPHDNPFGSLVAIYLVAKGSGVTLKLAGHVEADPVTGQLTTVFDDQPQQPFSRLHLEFFGGPGAPLTTPASCGTYTTKASFTGWNGKTVESDSNFQISPCLPARFSPGFTAGTVNPVAGRFSPFQLQLTRSDQDGELGALNTLTLPPGLLADAASVPGRCTDAQAAAASCPADSHIGTVTTGSGAGPSPVYVPGDVYLMGRQDAGPFKGDPFGLAIVVHAVAGPFDLGYVVVRSGVRINDDGSITTRTEPFPAILQGIPLQLRDIRVNLDRPGFTFNPTSCNPMSISGTVVSTASQQAGVSSRFQVGDCASLAFKPRFSASTAGKTSKANGASFHVHLASNEGPHSTGGTGESNIAKVDVQLPVSLPARLTTLQKACTSAQFASNPAGCPAASFVGTAIAHTPILASPLSGPAILVSHGGQAFPDLVLVLQGEGVRLNLTGHTQIKKGITFSHFETVPDAPVASFDLTLPQGPHSALTTDVPGRNLCANTRTVTVTKRVTRRVHGHNRKVKVKAKKAVAASLLMPTTLTAQNGAIIHQNTKIAVTGCVKAKVVKHAVKGKK